MKNFALYFAFGSNMSPTRMRKRCPGAVALGAAFLEDYRLSERLYADIDFAPGRVTFGVLYVLQDRHFVALDRFEGVPRVYRRIALDIEYEKEICTAWTYEMTLETKLLRHEMPYSEHYRKLCSSGAKFHRLPVNHFTRKKS